MKVVREAGGMDYIVEVVWTSKASLKKKKIKKREKLKVRQKANKQGRNDASESIQ